ncbi:MAG: iron-sulfur cluster assembly protein IscA [Acidiferrobacteraceae bacterium]|nr:iron-sulfur cluster assembly protein IscA [Acidiferrobacteraceae bacterium]|tara:strand:+ start:647 stop:973 length:327 start_codon:yes stop_codon:yes gene_type:complete
MTIRLTEAAAERVRTQLNNRGQGAGLRLGVTTTGCSGLAYVVNFADEILDEDNVYTSYGVQVIVDKSCIDYLDGTEIDFQEDGLSSSFTFNNPNVEGECGCGESFTVR